MYCFSLGILVDDRRQGTYNYIIHIYVIAKSFSPMCLFNCRNKLTTLSFVLAYILKVTKAGFACNSKQIKTKSMQKSLKRIFII